MSRESIFVNLRRHVFPDSKRAIPDLSAHPSQPLQALGHAHLLGTPPFALLEAEGAFEQVTESRGCPALQVAADQPLPLIALVASVLFVARHRFERGVLQPPAFASAVASDGLGPELV